MKAIIVIAKEGYSVEFYVPRETVQFHYLVKIIPLM